MAIKNIVLLGNPILRKISKEVKVFNREIPKLMTDLRETLLYLQHQYGTGRAIAAPQTGILKRVVYADTHRGRFTLINPRIIEKSKEVFHVWDSCFSFKVSFFVKIKRSRSIKIEYQNEIGEYKIDIFHDDLSELFQHEIDHLNGILAIDHLKGSQDILMREEWENFLVKSLD